MTPSSGPFCGRRTLRCDEDPGSPRYRYSSYGADTPLCCASHLVETTFALATLLEAHDIPYFILWGTHLGAVRHGGLIPWDTDVDLGVLAEDLPRVSLLAEPLAAQGFCLRDTPEKGCLTLDYSATNELHVDIYPWRREGASFVCQEYTIAEDRLLPLRRYPFHGRSLLGPRGLDYLFGYYGADCLERGRKQWLGWGMRLWRPGQSDSFELGDRSPAAIDLDRDYEAEGAPPGLLRRAEARLRHRAGLWKLRAYWTALNRDDTRARWLRSPAEDPRLKEWYLRSDALAARLTRAAYRAAKPHYQAIRAIPWQRTFRDNLRLLHDVLATTPMADRYWVIGGLLLGWAREGRPLLHDRDADFGIHEADREAFVAAVPRLVAAGFHPLYRWTNNAGAATEYCFAKDDVRFEFFVYDRVEDGLQCFVYYEAIECRCVVPAHGLAPMPFLGRTWQKPDDHEAYLTAVYGSWRVPNPYYNFLDDEQDIRERYPWHGTRGWPAGVDGAP